MVRFSLVILLYAVISCNNKYINYLGDGKTMISSDSLFFQKHYRGSKNIDLPKEIDINAIYLETHYLIGPRKVLYKRTDLFCGLYRFYQNGAVNDFSMSIDNDLNLSKLYNPDYRGIRGICFKENDKYYLDILGKSSELNTIGIYRYEFIESSKDTIKLKRVLKNHETVYVYARRPITNDTILNYKANW
jgi:hypothetical protein